MAKRITPDDAVKRINDRGVLLVFPINNRPLPLSLWSEFFPKTRMVWDWNDDAAGAVHDMWGLMKRLSDCREVVYSKWYQGRATFFSRDLFTAILCLRCRQFDARRRLSPTARTLFEVLENNSPLSTRKLKELTDLQGRLHEVEYSRAMKELFSRLLIVGFGEVDDGAFPSLAVGATELLYDELWRQAEAMSLRKAQTAIDRWMPQSSHFRRFFDKTTD
jgi:hypothetical protein